MKLNVPLWAIVNDKGELLKSAMDEHKPGDLLVKRFKDIYGTARLVRCRIVVMKDGEE